MAAAVGELGETLSPLTTASQELGKDRQDSHSAASQLQQRRHQRKPSTVFS